MDRALWLLIWLRFRGWLRRLTSILKTVRGILFAVFGTIIALTCLLSYVFSMAFAPHESQTIDADLVRRYGTLGLLAYCISILVFSSGERAIPFTPAEVNFLFPGPFSRRQLLAYKLAVTFLSSLVGTVFMSAFFWKYASSYLAAYTGILLTMTFLQLFSIVVALAASALGVLVYNRGRKLIFFLLTLAVAAAFWHSGSLPAADDWHQWANLPERSPIIAVLVAPLRWLVETFTAERVWPDLVKWATLGLLVNGFLAGLVFALDTHYLESAAAASERLYARLERLRMSGPAAQWGMVTKPPRFSLPSLPSWGGIGPIAWRQLLAAQRGFKGFLVLVVIVSFSLFWPLLLEGRMSTRGPAQAIATASALFIMTLFMVPALITFDFRGDYERMDLLKTLPISATRIVIGQLLAPTLMGSFCQLVLVLVLQLIFGSLGWLILAAIVFVLPFNFLVFAVENLLFLWFPSRNAPATAGDFQVLGRHMLLFWAKRMFLLALLTVIALFATAAFFVAGQSWLAAGGMALALLLGLDVAAVPMLASAFRRFDVAQNTPP